MNGAAVRRIYPVLLAGGSGSRLWPMSRDSYPKQFLPLVSEQSMLQDTVARVADASRFAPPLVICNEDHRFIVGEQLRGAAAGTLRGAAAGMLRGAAAGTIIVEPVGRNTAAPATVAALTIAEQDPEALLLLLPADHLIRDQTAFMAVVEQAAAAAAAGRLVTFGIVPTKPETGYGYIRRGAACAGQAGTGLDGVFEVVEFVEKPPLERAEQFLAEGGYWWNSGMFLFAAQTFLAEIERFEPQVLEGSRAALAGARPDLDFLRLDAAAFTAIPAISIDCAVMERTDRAAVVPAEIGWTDVGAWSSLWEVSTKDADGNVRIGDVVTEDVRNSYIRSEGALVTVLGLEDAVVVATLDAVLVADRRKVQDVKGLVERLRSQGYAETNHHRRVYRPWGYYQSLYSGDRFPHPSPHY
ncbi:mannose-1-phosphate guanylyltransferase [uncultured Gammaproteobacteria bacterium]